ncbi:hypothetical protein AC1031_007912 [Aphanomyces cochlioides]|nr:hypothetical protein AC1031_007912 [Aphanomyces cochlioides]
MQANKPKHVEYVVPVNAVMAALQAALGTLDNSSNGNGDIAYCKLALIRCGQDHLKLDVNLMLFDQFQALYSFHLAPVPVETIECWRENDEAGVHRSGNPAN